MKIDLNKGFTGKIPLEDGTVFTVIGGFTTKIEKNDITHLVGVIDTEKIQSAFDKGYTGTKMWDSRTSVTLDHGLVMKVEQNITRPI